MPCETYLECDLPDTTRDIDQDEIDCPNCDRTWVVMDWGFKVKDET